jgi:hypothetical protein
LGDVLRKYAEIPKNHVQPLREWRREHKWLKRGTAWQSLEINVLRERANYWTRVKDGLR